MRGVILHERSGFITRDLMSGADLASAVLFYHHNPNSEECASTSLVRTKAGLRTFSNVALVTGDAEVKFDVPQLGHGAVGYRDAYAVTVQSTIVLPNLLPFLVITASCQHVRMRDSTAMSEDSADLSNVKPALAGRK